MQLGAPRDPYLERKLQALRLVNPSRLRELEDADLRGIRDALYREKPGDDLLKWAIAYHSNQVASVAMKFGMAILDQMASQIAFNIQPGTGESYPSDKVTIRASSVNQPYDLARSGGVLPSSSSDELNTRLRFIQRIPPAAFPVNSNYDDGLLVQALLTVPDEIEPTAWIVSQAIEISAYVALRQLFAESVPESPSMFGSTRRIHQVNKSFSRVDHGLNIAIKLRQLKFMEHGFTLSGTIQYEDLGVADEGVPMFQLDGICFATDDGGATHLQFARQSEFVGGVARELFERMFFPELDETKHLIELHAQIDIVKTTSTFRGQDVPDFSNSMVVHEERLSFGKTRISIPIDAENASISS